MCSLCRKHCSHCSQCHLCPQWLRRYKKQVAIITVMIVSGAILVILLDYSQKLYAKGSNGHKKAFSHPYFVICLLFGAVMMCLPVFFLIRRIYSCRGLILNRERRPYNPLIYLFPAVLSLLCQVLNCVALKLTFASSYQLQSGVLVILTGLLSMSFVHRRINVHMWVGMTILSVAGICYSLGDILFYPRDPGENQRGINVIVSGELLIWVVMIIRAVQFMYEEAMFNANNAHPLEAAGYEGLFGFLLTGILLVPSYFVKLGAPYTFDPSSRLEDVWDALNQMKDNLTIVLVLLGAMVAAAVYKAAGLYVTKEISATSRVVMNTLHVIIFWPIFNTIHQWNMKCSVIQLSSFVVQILGIMVYQDVVFGPCLRRLGWLREPGRHSDDFEPLHDLDRIRNEVQRRPATKLRSDCAPSHPDFTETDPGQDSDEEPLISPLDPLEEGTSHQADDRLLY